MTKYVQKERLTYYRSMGGTIKPNERVGRNELIFLEYTTSTGLRVCSIAMPQIYSCPKGIACSRTCEIGSRREIICNPEYYNRALHNFDIIKRHTELKVITEGNYWGSIISQVESIAKKYRYFLWNFTGEIQSIYHFEVMLRVAKRCPDTRFLCRTRLAGIVLQHIGKERNNEIPSNLSVVMVPVGAMADKNLFVEFGNYNIKGGV